MSRRIAVFGTGYLGATHAACMAQLGHEVIGVDVDKPKLASLALGTAPFFEPGLDELLRSNIDSGRLRFTSSYAAAAEFADVHFIAVATPQKRGELAADVTHVDAVIRELSPLLRVPAITYGKSTVPVGTAAASERLSTSHCASVHCRRSRMEPGVPQGGACDKRYSPPRSNCARDRS